MVKFNTHFEKAVKLVPTQFEKIDHVERAGYVPLKNQIQAFREAGVMLRATRAMQYHTDDDGFKSIDDVKKELFTFGGVDYSDMSELTARSAALAAARMVKDSVSVNPADKSDSGAVNATTNDATTSQSVGD